MQARNTTQCPRMPTLVEGLEQPVAHACIPLRFEGGLRGVLNVAARPGEVFSDDELKFLQTLGHQIGIAVERARHAEAERLRNQEARAMAAISKAVGGSLDPQAVLAAVGGTALDILGADRVAVLLGTEAGHLEVAHLAGLPHPELAAGSTLDLQAKGARFLMAALEDLRPVSVSDLRREPRANSELAERWGNVAAVAVPMVARGRTLGLLLVACAEVRHWTPEQVEVAEVLAAQASVALENARLFEELRKAYEELKGAQERIIRSEKMAMLGTFASGLAHEVRNPLNSIGLQLSILERRIGRCEPGLARQMSELVGIIREEIRRLDSLVGDFLLFSRTNRIQFAPTSLDSILEEVLTLLEPEAREAGIALQLQRRVEPLPRLRVDAEKMKQVFINLMRNALEAVSDGGLVRVVTSASNGKVSVSVEDDGPGLPEGLDVFQLFVTTKPKGTGLGLSIVQQIVLQHGGEVAATSEPGRGARFTVTLPIVPAEAPQ